MLPGDPDKRKRIYRDVDGWVDETGMYKRSVERHLHNMEANGFVERRTAWKRINGRRRRMLLVRPTNKARKLVPEKGPVNWM